MQSRCRDVWKNLNFPSITITHVTECLAFKRDRHSALTVHRVDQMRNKGATHAAAKPERVIGEDWGGVTLFFKLAKQLF